MTTKIRMKILILLPVMNEAIWIERCMASLVNQDQEGLAILVQENCSDDGSAEIISKFALDFPNIYIFENSSRVDSWRNWDTLINNALEYFDFEYLFWIGGDDYLLESNFLKNLYDNAMSSNLQLVSPTIVAIDSENGQQKEIIEFTLTSKLKVLRIIQYCNDWRNVNIFHSLISKELYVELFKISGNSHTSYIGNDWWIVLSIIKKHGVQSVKNSHFFKSQWSARRYQWITDSKIEVGNKPTFLPAKRFLEHIFQDMIILVEHAFRRHPLKEVLTRTEIFVIVFIFFLRAFFRPIFHLAKYVYMKLVVHLRNMK